VTILTAARYELRMQLRRKALWIAFGLVSAIALPLLGPTPWRLEPTTPLPEVVAQWSLALSLFHPVVFGCLLADRLARARRLHIEELAATTPSTPGTRLLATYLGATTATLLPVGAVWALGVGVTAVRWGDWSAVPLGLAAFVTVNLPGLLFIAAFSLVCPLALSLPLYQFLFIGYYMWGNWIGPSWGIPTISGTWLTPAGGYAASGLFDARLIHGGQATTSDALASIALLLAVAAAVLVVARWWLSRPLTGWPTEQARPAHT
jgi:hypothetical protein